MQAGPGPASLFAAMPAPVAVVMRIGDAVRVAEASHAFLAEFGLGSLSAGGMDLDELLPPAAASILVEAIDRCIRSSEPARVQVEITLGGETARREVVAQRFAEGLDSHVLLTSMPARQALPHKLQTDLFDRLGPLSRGLIYIYDVVGKRTRYIHPRLIDMLGIRQSELPFSAIFDLVHPEDHGKFAQFMAEQEHLDDESVSNVQLRARHREGRWIWMHVRSRVFSRGRDGRVRRAIGVVSDFTANRELESALAEAAVALAQAEERVRRRVGRELHDSTMQHLVGIDLAISSLERQGVFLGASRRALKDVRTSLRAAHQEIRISSYMLHPPQLEHSGLEKTLVSFCKGFERRTGLAVTPEILRKTRRLSPATEIALFRIAQEALMNAYRHAHATHVSVRLYNEPGAVVLEIEDDGVGLPENPLTLEADPPDGVGLSGMRARLLQLGGDLRFENLFRGLRVVARAPLTTTADESPHWAKGSRLRPPRPRPPPLSPPRRSAS
jgi:PAS domain S-box-containing protein